MLGFGYSDPAGVGKRSCFAESIATGQVHRLEPESEHRMVSSLPLARSIFRKSAVVDGTLRVQAVGGKIEVLGEPLYSADCFNYLHKAAEDELGPNAGKALGTRGKALEHILV